MNELVRGNTLYRMGYQSGHDDTIARYNAVIAPAMHKVTISLSELVAVVEKIAEVSLVGEFRPDYMIKRLEILSPELSERAQRLKNALTQMPREHPIRLDGIVQLVSDVQDLIKCAFEGDKGAALRDFMLVANIRETASGIIDLGGRPQGMEQETRWLAERAIYIKKGKKRFYWYKVGFAIFKELISASKLKAEEQAALELLTPFIAETEKGKGDWYIALEDDLGKYISNLVSRYKNSLFHQKGVIEELQSGE